VIAGPLQGDEPVAVAGGRRLPGQQPVDRHVEEVDDVEQLAHRGVGLAGLDLGEGAGADAEPPGRLPERQALAQAFGAQAGPEVDDAHGRSVQGCSARLDAR
jgi:hypothetical protein